LRRVGMTFAVAALGVLAGCQTLSGASIAKLATPLKADILASGIGAGLSEKARIAAANAEYRALEAGRAGTAVGWRVSDKVFGTVTPQQPYTVGTTNCRRFTHAITVNGTQHSATGTACRGDDGVWTPLS